MRHRHICMVPLLVILTAPLGAGQAGIELPKYNDQQRWSRAARFSVLGFVYTIALGKAKGMTVEEVGAWMGKQAAPTWSRPLTPKGLLNGTYRNFLISPEAVLEVQSASDDQITFRTNRPYLGYFGDSMVLHGVSVAEYEQAYTIVSKAIADWGGLQIEQKLEGPWWITTIRTQK